MCQEPFRQMKMSSIVGVPDSFSKGQRSTLPCCTLRQKQKLSNKTGKLLFQKETIESSKKYNNLSFVILQSCKSLAKIEKLRKKTTKKMI